MFTISDFIVGDTWLNAGGEKFRVIAIDELDKVRPVVTRTAMGEVACFSPDGRFGAAVGPFDLVTKAPRETVKTLCLFRSASGEEIIMCNNVRPRLTGYELVSVTTATFVEGLLDV